MIVALTFEQIFEVWNTKLWPNRKSKIEPVSAMTRNGGIDISIQTYEPMFFGYELDGVLVGVNSFVQTDENEYRSRGLYVDPMCRGQGIAQALLTALENVALADRDKTLPIAVWSVPRQSALPAYLKAGYTQTSEFFDEGMEFGPNCYVEKVI